MAVSRVSDPAEGAKGRGGAVTLAALLAEVDAEQARLRVLVAGREEGMLAERPVSGKWSVVENVRHLVFTELAHHSHLAAIGDGWRSAVLPPHDLAVRLREKMVGDATTTVGEALEVWQPLHASVRAALLEHDTGDETYRFGRHIRHLQQHVNEVQRLLRAQARAEKRPRGPRD